MVLFVERQESESTCACRVVRNPNSLFYCGDTCQTIARGVGFRFADIRTLFWEESLRRKASTPPSC